MTSKKLHLKGKILEFDPTTGIGIIKAETGQEFYFNTNQQTGAEVEFDKVALAWEPIAAGYGTGISVVFTPHKDNKPGLPQQIHAWCALTDYEQAEEELAMIREFSVHSEENLLPSEALGDDARGKELSLEQAITYLSLCKVRSEPFIGNISGSGVIYTWVPKRTNADNKVVCGQITMNSGSCMVRFAEQSWHLATGFHGRQARLLCNVGIPA